MPLKKLFYGLFANKIGLEAMGNATHRDNEGKLKEHIVELWVRPKKEEVDKMHRLVGEFEIGNGMPLQKSKIAKNGRVFYGFAKDKKPNLDKFTNGRNSAVLAIMAKRAPSKLLRGVLRRTFLKQMKKIRK